MTDVVAELYALPLDQFTGARNELAGRLRKGGQRQQAEAIHKLPKPSITAWALDQAARQAPEVIAEVLDASQQLRSAQERLIAQGDQAAFRTAAEKQRWAIEAAVQAAARVLQAGGHPAGKTVTDRLEATLRAAAADPERGDLLRRGALAVDLNPAGFGGLEGVFGVAAARSEAAPPPAEPHPAPEKPANGDAVRLAAAQARIEALRDQLGQLQTEAAEAQHEAAARRETADVAERTVAGARAALTEAERRLTEAAQAAADAQARAGAAQEQAGSAAAELAAAEQQLRGLLSC